MMLWCLSHVDMSSQPAAYWHDWLKVIISCIQLHAASFDFARLPPGQLADTFAEPYVAQP